jgi:hypothetical protein
VIRSLMTSAVGRSGMKATDGGSGTLANGHCRQKDSRRDTYDDSREPAIAGWAGSVERKNARSSVRSRAIPLPRPAVGAPAARRARAARASRSRGIGAREVEALRFAAAVGFEDIRPARGFHAFGGHVEIQLVARPR